MNDYFAQIGMVKSGARLLRGYAVGFMLALAATFLAFDLVMRGTLPRPVLVVSIMALALLQATVQARWFLHLNFERNSRRKLVVFAFAILVVAILVAGSLWIMTHLNTRMTADPALMGEYMQSQDGF